MTKKSFLGKGIKFPFQFNEKGNLAMSEEEDSIRESILIILGTPKGERIMEPDFGCEIHDLIFYPNNENTASIVSYYVSTAIKKWEPRVSEVIVNAFPDPYYENLMIIQIKYRVITTNNLQNLVYPFYLRREQDL